MEGSGIGDGRGSSACFSLRLVACSIAPSVPVPAVVAASSLSSFCRWRRGRRVSWSWSWSWSSCVVLISFSDGGVQGVCVQVRCSDGGRWTVAGGRWTWDENQEKEKQKEGKTRLGSLSKTTKRKLNYDIALSRTGQISPGCPRAAGAAMGEELGSRGALSPAAVRSVRAVPGRRRPEGEGLPNGPGV